MYFPLKKDMRTGQLRFNSSILFQAFGINTLTIQKERMKLVYGKQGADPNQVLLGTKVPLSL